MNKYLHKIFEAFPDATRKPGNAPHQDCVFKIRDNLKSPLPEEQAKQQEAQLKAKELEVKMQKIQQESAIKQQEMQLEAEIAAQDLELKKQEASVDMQIKAQELEIKKAELALKQQELVLEREQERAVKIGN